VVFETVRSTIHSEVRFSGRFSITQTPDFDIGVLHEMVDLR
jgi:hypothetical protein